MKKLLAVGLLSFVTYAAPVKADPTFMLGVAYTFSGEIGFTAKLLSNDEEDGLAASIGTTYYPYAYEQVGIDLGGVYMFDDIAVGASYDLIQATPHVSAGYADTQD